MQSRPHTRSLGKLSDDVFGALDNLKKQKPKEKGSITRKTAKKVLKRHHFWAKTKIPAYH